MADISIANLDAGTDSPAAARVQLLEAVQRVNALASTADGAGSELLAFKANATGAIDSTADEKLNAQPLDAVTDFGCDPTGATNSTTAMKAFFDAAIINGRGHIPRGDYLITAGVLVFDNGHVDTLWPTITTDGYEAVTFLRADATNAPMITLSNGTAVSGAGKFWLGGHLGGITFSQNGKAQATSQHGLSLRGCNAIRFGHMRLNDAGGSCIYLPETLYATNNPDPYHVGACQFEGIEANRCVGMGLENRNWVGLTLNKIAYLRVIECQGGGWYGLGAGNEVELISMGTVKGWAVDDGTATASTGGSPSRATIGVAELDDVQNGIRLNKTSISGFGGIRFVHRHNFNATYNPGEGYWPRTAISIGGGTSPSVAQIQMDVIHRIEAGGTKPAMGVFVNLHSAGGNIVALNVDQRILDNAGFGFADADLFTGDNANTVALLTRDRKPIRDLMIKVGALVRAAAGTTIGTTGYGAIGAKVIFATELYDRGAYYDSTNGWFTVPYSGLYRLSGRITLTPNATATTMSCGFGAAVAGVFSQTLIDKKHAFSAGLGQTTFEVDGVVNLTVGQQVFFMAAQNGGTSNLASPISDTANQTWSIEAL